MAEANSSARQRPSLSSLYSEPRAKRSPVQRAGYAGLFIRVWAQHVLQSCTVRGRGWATIVIGAVSGVCFAALAARSISVLAITPHHFRLSSLVVAIIMVFLSYLAFRAATSGRTDEESFLRACATGVGGSLLAFGVIAVMFIMFRQAMRAYFAHPIGLHFSQVTMIELVVALLCLGFAAGFVLRLATLRGR